MPNYTAYLTALAMPCRSASSKEPNREAPLDEQVSDLRDKILLSQSLASSRPSVVESVLAELSAILEAGEALRRRLFATGRTESAIRLTHTVDELGQIRTPIPLLESLHQAQVVHYSPDEISDASLAARAIHLKTQMLHYEIELDLPEILRQVNALPFPPIDGPLEDWLAYYETTRAMFDREIPGS
jgi:hypothetical protein